MPAVKKTTLKKDLKTKLTKDVKSSPLALNIYSLDGKITKTVELPKAVFSFKVNVGLLAQYIRVFQVNQRQGNASTKSRGQVSGSTKKIYRQKGTGRARHGSIKAPIFVGGGVVGGPKPCDYSLKMNKKQKTQALFGSLTLKQKNHSIYGFFYDEKSFSPKSKTIAQFIKKLGIKFKNILCVLPKVEKSKFVLAARNIEGIKMVDGRSLNAYEVMKAQVILMNEDVLKFFEKSLNNEN